MVALEIAFDMFLMEKSRNYVKETWKYKVLESLKYLKDKNFLPFNIGEVFVGGLRVFSEFFHVQMSHSL